MEQSINHCPHCNGTGKKTLKITFIGHPEKNEETKIDCIICEGKPMSKEDAIKEKKSIEDEKKLWCNCSNKTDSYYVADTKKMKHHWRCKTCKKITQIG